jgi:heme-degrading monooxygenase HmoA
MMMVVFRSRVRTDFAGEIGPMDKELRDATMPGFIEYKEYAAQDGEYLTIALFQDAQSLQAWREHPRHREAIKLGYERWMASYDISICEVTRRYSRDDRAKGVADGAPIPGSVTVWDPQLQKVSNNS